MLHGRRPSAWTGAIIAALTAAAPVSSTAQQSTAPATTTPRAALSQPLTARLARPGIDWKGAATAAGRYANRLGTLTGSLNPAAVDKTRVPILLPTDPDLMKGARIYSFGDYYTVSADIAGGGVSLTGTTATVPMAEKLKVAPLGTEQLVLQRTVDGYLASFVRYGVLYTAEVRCDAPSDERCRTEAFVRALVSKSTVVVMGKAARQAAGLEG